MGLFSGSELKTFWEPGVFYLIIDFFWGVERKQRSCDTTEGAERRGRGRKKLNVFLGKKGIV